MIKFADDYLDKLEPGTVLLFTGDPYDDDFTRKEEYKVYQKCR
jgi:hypothetical protein